MPVGHTARMEINMNAVYMKNLALFGTRGMPSWRYPSLLALIEHGDVDFAPLIAREVALGDASAELRAFNGPTAARGRRDHRLRALGRDRDMKAAVIVFPGSNCDRDLAVALRAAGAEVAMVWHKETDAARRGSTSSAIPGGFSFGDYLRCGAIAARSPVMRAVVGLRPRAAATCSGSATASRC